MPIPAFTQTLTDNALGLVPEDTSTNCAVVGTCSSGTAGTVVYAYSSTDAIDDLRSELGVGPAVEAAAYHLSTNGSTVYVVRVDTTGGTAAAASSVTLTGSGLNPGVTVSVATAYDDYAFKVRIIAGGSVGTATFQYSKDGGNNYSGTITSASTYAIPNTGITIAFTAGTYVANDIYSFTTTAAVGTTTKYGEAIQAFTDSQLRAGLGHVVGRPGGASDTLKSSAFASLVAAVQSKAATSALSQRYMRWVVDSPVVANDSTADGLLVTAFASTDAARCVAAADSCDLISAIDESRLERPSAWPIVARARQVGISEHLGYVGRGSLGSTIQLQTSTTQDSTPVKHLDARVRSTLDSNRFATLRSHIGRQGVYITRPLTMAAANSDYSSLQNGRVIDRACEVAYDAGLNFLNSSVRVNATTGRILEADAKAIESRIMQALRDAILSPGHASAVSVTVNRTDNILSTGTLRIKTRVTPLGYAEQIENEIGFVNPSIATIAA